LNDFEDSGDEKPVSATEIWSDGRVLANTEHEAFALSVAQGRSYVDAWKHVYGSDHKASRLSTAPSRVARRPEVALRIKNIREEIAKRVIEHAAINEAYVIDKIKLLIDASSGTSPVYDRSGAEVGRKLIDGGSLAKGVDMAAKVVGLYRERRAASPEEGLTFDQLVSKLKGLNEQERQLVGGSPVEADSSEGEDSPGAVEEEPRRI
jgi:hypothetical protein